MENTGTFLTTLDFVVFFGSLLGVMALGLLAGRNESTSKDYFLAGRNVRWWGVAGSIFGSNISANHMVGMMGVGFTLGFAESHFEITAIAGLLLLCYCFLPVYRKLNIFTLSDYLSRRYDDKSRVAYSVIMILIITMVMMLPAFYIGSRSVNFLLVDQAQINEVLKASAGGVAQTIEIDKTYYILGVLIMALVTGVYTIVGGLKAVIVTDVLQSVLMLAGALIVAWFTFNSVEIGGWDGMRALDSKGKDLVHLYLPSDHPQRPWSGMLSGLMVLHFYYWGANQFIVQRALAAKTDKEARVGIITAGFVKLLIPFISIGTGIAAYYVFAERMPGVQVDGDTAFPLLLREVVAPAGVAGLVGLVAAGLIGAILSSVDSMLNSASTLFTMDIYKRHIRPNADAHRIVRVGRMSTAVFVILGCLLAPFPARFEGVYEYMQLVWGFISPAILPPRTTTIRSQMLRMSVNRWLTSRIDTPRDFNSKIISQSLRIFSAESAAVGSSISNVDGSNCNARATATIWRSPPDNMPTSRSTSKSSPMLAMSSAAARVMALLSNTRIGP